MTGRLRRVIVRRPDDSFTVADPSAWNYKRRPSLEAALVEHKAFTDILEAAGAEVIYYDEPLPGFADALYTHDPVLITNAGAVILRMGKILRRGEEVSMEGYLRTLGVPILGRLDGNAQAECGDLLWLDDHTLAIGIGFRTTLQGARQLAEILAPLGVETRFYHLPFYRGPNVCLHLMSLVSLIDQDLAVIYPAFTPVTLWQDLKERGIELIKVPGDEFENGHATNVLATAPRRCIMMEGNRHTETKLREAGCEVTTYRGKEITLVSEGGATCLTRPLLRDPP